LPPEREAVDKARLLPTEWAALIAIGAVLAIGFG
jgi:hypothetical protein